jgi:hypothetical protein
MALDERSFQFAGCAVLLDQRQQVFFLRARPHGIHPIDERGIERIGHGDRDGGHDGIDYHDRTAGESAFPLGDARPATPTAETDGRRRAIANKARRYRVIGYEVRACILVPAIFNKTPARPHETPRLHGSTAPRLIGGSQRVAERKRARFQCTAAASRRHFFQRIQAACGIPSMHRAVCVCQCPERQMHRTRACRQWQTGRAPVKLIPASRADGSCDEQEARGSVADGPRMVQQPAGTWHRARAWRIGRVPSFRHPKP